MATHANTPHAGHARGTPRTPFASGWTLTAAVLMIFGGVMAILEGVAALARDDVFVTSSNYTFEFSLTGWGWIHLALGIVILLAGMALFRDALWARAVGVAVAGFSMIANFIWLPHAPAWSVALIAVDAFIIWALCAPRIGSPRDVR